MEDECCGTAFSFYASMYKVRDMFIRNWKEKMEWYFHLNIFQMIVFV